jgi:glycosyltransferase involved in cell wall biosynthesis
MDEASVSVVIPTFNRGHLIGRAIESALGQTRAPAEVIVVDDGSADDTGRVVAGYSAPALKYVRLDRNGGGAAARNAGIRVASGDYVAFLDSDDEWHPDHLRGLVDVARHRSGDFVVSSSALRLGRNPRVLPGREYPEGRGLAERLHFVITAELAFQTSTLLMPRRTALRYLFDPRLRRYQDWDLVFRLIEGGAAMILLPEASITYNQAGRDTITLTRSDTPSLRFIAKHGARMSNKSMARFVALQVMRRRRMRVLLMIALCYAAMLGGIGAKELAYYVLEAWLPTTLRDIRSRRDADSALS